MTDKAGPPGDTDARHVGVYRLCRPLGRGGMGEVFLAHDDRLDRPVAIKRIRRGREVSDVDRERFRREARAAAKLNHPAITQVYDVVRDDDGDSIVMEYVEGRTLADLLAAGGLDGEHASDVALQVAEGLAAAHGKGFVHRDLKAENVMVTPEGRVKILDFGLAKTVSREAGIGEEDRQTLTETGALVGTVSTMSPEQAAGGRVDARSDLFSFGVLLYEIFTGHSPFRRGDRMQSLRSVLAESPPPPRALRPELPEALSALIEELLAKNPNERPASAEVVGSRLRESSGVVAGLAAPRPSPGAERAAVVSDAPTRSQAAASALRPPPARAAGSGSAKRWPWAIAALVLLVAGVVLLRDIFVPEPASPLRVLVLEPRVDSADAGAPSKFVVFGVLQAMLSTLASLEGLDPVDARSWLESPSGATWEAAREVAADEVLTADVQCEPARCAVSFTRLDGQDGEMLGKSIEYYLPKRPEDALDRAGLVRGAVLEVYPEREPRSRSPREKPNPEDYKTYLELKLRNDSGESLGRTELEQLEGLVKSSPELIEAYLLAAEVARNPLGEPDRARRLVSAATRIEPEDPRLLFVRARREIADGRLDEADEAIRELERTAPGDLRTMMARAQLHEARGERQKAMDAYAETAEQWPSWRNVVQLADYESSDRRTSEVARRRLEELLDSYPNNEWVKIRLAALATWRGELRRAEELYGQLRRKELASFAIPNLGWIHFLAGSYGEAEQRYREALEIAPGDPVARFNLALAWDAQGYGEKAQETFQELLTDLAPGSETQSGPRCPDEGQCRMIRAQCLLRSGRHDEALRLTEETLRQYPDDVQVIYQAAQVYALAGKPSSARHHTEQALKKLLHPVWFEIPSFEALRSDPEFQEILALYL